MDYLRGSNVDKVVIAGMPPYFRKVSVLFSCIYLFHRQFYFNIQNELSWKLHVC